MRTLLCIALGLAAALPSAAKTNDKSANDPPKDPRALLTAAAPFYDYTSPDLKSWHLKATYQLFDENGKPTEQGTYEYWWASPQVYRSTWTRAGASESDWMTPKGRYILNGASGISGYYERSLKRSLLSPMPNADLLEKENSFLASKRVENGSIDMDCVMVVSKHLGMDSIAAVAFGMFPTYCFDARTRALLASYSFESLTSQFPKVVRTQGHYLASKIVLSERGHQVLSATVDTVDAVTASDPAFTPSPGATPAGPTKRKSIPKQEAAKAMPEEAGVPGERTVPIPGQVAIGMLIHQVPPVYPEAARSSRVQGTVVLHALIGTDGNVHDLSVTSAPSAVFIGTSLAAVSQWKYKPYLLGGRPIEVETSINIIFSLSGSTSFDFR